MTDGSLVKFPSLDTVVYTSMWDFFWNSRKINYLPTLVDSFDDLRQCFLNGCKIATVAFFTAFLTNFVTLSMALAEFEVPEIEYSKWGMPVMVPVVRDKQQQHWNEKQVSSLILYWKKEALTQKNLGLRWDRWIGKSCEILDGLGISESHIQVLKFELPVVRSLVVVLSS